MAATERLQPHSDDDRRTIHRLGTAIDALIEREDMWLTQGCEPTFVSAGERDAPEWNHAALGSSKRTAGETLLRRLQRCWAPGALMLSTQGKWYPGEALPRWALGLFWLKEGGGFWSDARLNALGSTKSGDAAADARSFADALTGTLGLDPSCAVPAYEDPWTAINAETRLPPGVDPLRADLASSAERARLARLLHHGLGNPIGFAIPLKSGPRSAHSPGWMSHPWRLRREHLFLVPGDTELGYRLPLDTLARDDAETIDTALCIEARDGQVHVFLPPLEHLDDYVRLIVAIEKTARATGIAVVPEGYEPPADPRVQLLRITPDPGVLEVNLHPAGSWPEFDERIRTLYREAAEVGLSAEKYLFDGRCAGTGGGCHITLGGATPAESPIMRRPALLQSLVTYWQNHPALSYLFAGLFIGPTSQAPRVDEAREDSLYELEIAFQQLALLENKPEAIHGADALLRHLLVDVTGNRHRSEFCIDKLDAAGVPNGELGLLELRAFEMAPDPDMSLLQALLVRALAVRFWREPHPGSFVRWGTALHDRFMLPHFLRLDLEQVVRELREAGFAFQPEWFTPFIDFRCPHIGAVTCGTVHLSVRHALEPWLVLADAGTGATARTVDSSLERLEITVRDFDPHRHAVVCDRRRLSLQQTGMPGEYLAAVRFRAWQFHDALHPTIDVHAPLTLDVVELATGRSLGGCTFHVMDPAGEPYARRPATAAEADARRKSHFVPRSAGGTLAVPPPEPPNPLFPLTLDLRYRPA